MSRFLFSFQLVDTIDDPVAITSDAGVYLYCNNSYLDLIAKTSFQVIGYTAAKVLPLSFLELEIAAERSLNDSSDNYIEYQMNCRNLHPFDISASVHKGVLKDDGGQTEGILTLVKLNELTAYAAMGHKYQLTNQELRVFKGLIKGLPVKVVAESLKISMHTVSGHMKEIYKKVGVKSRHELQYLIFQSQKNPLSYWRRHFTACKTIDA